MATKTPLSDINRNLHRLVFSMDKMAEELLSAHFDVTFSQFRMLMGVEKGKLTCQSHIAKFFGLTPAAISRQIDLLTEKKLIVSKTNHENRREHILELTKKGKGATKKAIELFDHQFQKAYSVLTPHEQELFAGNLQKLTEQFCTSKHARKNV